MDRLRHRRLPLVPLSLDPEIVHKRVIPHHVGEPLRDTVRRLRSGLVGSHIDDICVIRSMYSDNGNHGPSLLMMNSGHGLTGRPAMGSWITYGLGTENQNLPGFVVLCPGYPV